MRPGPDAESGPADLPQTVTLALLAALPQEVRPFLRRIKARRRLEGGLPAWEWAVGPGRAVLALTGMGRGAAYGGAAKLLARFRPAILVSLGFGGALTPALAPGTLVLGASLWDYDPNTGALTSASLPPPPQPLPRMLQALENAGLPALAGSVVTTSAILCKGRQAGPLTSLHHPVVELETSALAGVAASRGMAFLSLRAITDAAGEEIPAFLAEGWQSGAAPGPRDAWGWLARDPRRLSSLLHLWSRSRLAARRLAQALTVLLPWLGEPQGGGESR